MINFFRKIRRQLAGENKFQRYMRYAVGEVLLIMLGILMALQLQNWNDKQKQETRFKATLEQLYTSITYESHNFVNDTMWFKTHSNWIDQLLYNPDSIPETDLPIKLYYITYWNGGPFSSEMAYYAQHLNYDPDDNLQVGLVKEILTYINGVTNYKKNVDDRLEKAIEQVNISIPIIDVDTYNHQANPSDSLHYDFTDIQVLQNWLRSSKIRAILKKVKAYKDRNYIQISNLILDGQSIKNLIKNYYPGVKELYKDLGIIGSSTDGGWDKSTPMTLTDEASNIWEIEMFLKVGDVKFRCRDSWAQNWGNNNPDFPSGRGFQDGGNIPITEAGNYRIIFKPVIGEYEFIKLDE